MTYFKHQSKFGMTSAGVKRYKLLCIALFLIIGQGLSEEKRELRKEWKTERQS